MLERELIFNYKTSLSNIYDKGVEDNADLIAVIPEIIGYEQGRWDNGKRKDWMVYKMTDIPENLRKTIEMFLNKEGEIRFRIKIYKQLYEYIETKMTNYFIKKIDNYIKTLE